jgi:hypothetical protein
MDYTADFLRGWPNEGALESSGYPIATGQSLEAGDLVVLTAGGLTKVVGETNAAGIVVRGNVDDKSVGASGRAIVLWSGYIVRTTKIDAAVMGLSPMAKVNAVDAVFDVATVTAAATDSTLGTVLETIIGLNGNPDSAVILVK